MRGLANKRHQNLRWQKRRARYYARYGETINAAIYGKGRKTHRGCGCSMCKPWKHGWEKKLKLKERMLRNKQL